MAWMSKIVELDSRADQAGGEDARSGSLWAGSIVISRARPLPCRYDGGASTAAPLDTPPPNWSSPVQRNKL